MLSICAPGWIGSGTAIIAFAICTIGIVAERWLFFAESKHVVNLYYNATVRSIIRRRRKT